MERRLPLSVNTKISWTDNSFTCVTGCTPHSMGCRRCYAKSLTKVLQSRKGINNKYSAGFDQIVMHPHLLKEPLRWNGSGLVFVNSMSDTFHEQVPLEFIQELFDVLGKAERYQFQILTKRSKRLVELAPHLTFHPNIWMGVTVEHQRYVERIDDLRKVPAKIRFLSIEPMLSPLPNLKLDGIHWVIVGGESGFGSVPMNAEWARDVRDQCQKKNVAFFFKQWGGVNNKYLGNNLDGQTWEQFPANFSTFRSR